MRTIKFRIWNGQKMETNVMVGFLGAFYVSGMDKEDAACMSSFNTKYSETTPLMQSTGVMDKNGKEIYEGDIIRFKSWRDSLQRYEPKTMKVEYLKGFFCPLVSFSDDPSNREYEIIGNIYENTELVEGVDL